MSLRVQRYFVIVAGLTCLLAGLYDNRQGVATFFTENWHTIILHTVMGIVFALTGAWARGMCEHTWHKFALGGFLIIAEGIFTVAIIG